MDEIKIIVEAETLYYLRLRHASYIAGGGKMLFTAFAGQIMDNTVKDLVNA